jgi:Mg2+-importing ATPase
MGPARRITRLTLLLNQFRSPLLLILLIAAVLSFFLRDAADAVIILGIVTLSACLGFWHEWTAADAMKKLLARVRTRASVLRDGERVSVPVEEVVPGDVVILAAGDAVPGDGRILESRDLYVEEAALTGESFPLGKAAGTLPTGTPLSGRSNSLWMART